jgi:hypothetical protein
MTTGPASHADEPRRLLLRTRELTRQVRKTQRATWFPLLVFAAVTFAAIPAYGFGGRHLGTCASVPGGRVCAAYSLGGLVYWPIALVLAYVAIAAFYIRRSQARGVGTRVRPYVIAGIILALAMTGTALWTLHHPLTYGHALPRLSALASYSCAIGLALLVLARAERNWVLLVLTFGYLAAVLVPAIFGWVTSYRGSAFPLQLVIDGSILLLGGIGFALAQRPWQRAA